MSIDHQSYASLANRVHQKVLADQTNNMGTLGSLEGEMDSMRSTENTLTAEELRRKYLDLTTPTLSEKIRSLEVSYLSVAGRTKDGGDNFLRRISQMKAEYERRTEGKPWLKQVGSFGSHTLLHYCLCIGWEEEDLW